MKLFDFGAFEMPFQKIKFMKMLSHDKIIFHVLFGAFHITPRISKSLKRAGATWIDRIRGQNNGHWWIHD